MQHAHGRRHGRRTPVRTHDAAALHNHTACCADALEVEVRSWRHSHRHSKYSSVLDIQHFGVVGIAVEEGEEKQRYCSMGWAWLSQAWAVESLDGQRCYCMCRG